MWLPTAPTPPIGTYLGLMRPFSLRSADVFRPNGPPHLRSKRWARDYNEVKEMGSLTSTTRTAEQTLAAKFWAEPPVQQARGSFRKFVLDHELDIVDASRFMAMISVTYADALIACFDAKYHVPSGGRSPRSGRATRTTTAARWSTRPGLRCTGRPTTRNTRARTRASPRPGVVIAKFLGTKRIDFTVPSLTGLGDRHFDPVKDLTYEVGNARIWGGIHFRTAVEDGITIGTRW